jgi:coronin-1B/1C/6
MSRFVRNSKYRHVFGQPAKRELNYDNVRPSTNAHDSNLIKANPQFISLNWQASGGGSFAVIPVSQVGKQQDALPLYNGHSGPVLDTDFNPFNDHVLASASEDATVKIWKVQDEQKETITTPQLTLNGHGRKVGYVYFHPTAANVLMSVSADLTCKLWDIEHGKERLEVVGHVDQINACSFNWTGSQFASTSKDRKLRVFDIRNKSVVHSSEAHQGAKSSRVVWMGDSDNILTVGFSKTSDRQLFVWDTKNMNEPLRQVTLDTSAGVIMPFYDADTKLIYLAGKGDGNVRYYEWDTTEQNLFPLSQYSSSEPQRGFAFAPKRAVNLQETEIYKGYKLQNTIIEVVSFTVPRKSDQFASDLYPETVGDTPSLTAEEYFGGKTKGPILISLEKGFVPAVREFTSTVQEEVNEEKLPSNEKEYQEAYHKLRKENDKLKNEVAQKDVKIRQLEVQLQHK